MLRVLIFSIFASSAAFAAESGGMPQLNPNSWVPQIFWLIITFGGLYIVISKIVFPRLLKIPLLNLLKLLMWIHPSKRN